MTIGPVAYSVMIAWRKAYTVTLVMYKIQNVVYNLLSLNGLSKKPNFNFVTLSLLFSEFEHTTIILTMKNTHIANSISNATENDTLAYQLSYLFMFNSSSIVKSRG